jgi:DNA uptake protein ComE-like DNA-binding protein
MAKYNHPTYGAVDVIRDFGHYVRIQTKDGAQSVRMEELTEVAAPIAFPTIGRLDHGQSADDAADAPPIGITVAINRASANVIAKALPSVGKLKARQIVDAKPDGGYANFDDLRSTVSDLFGDHGADDWARIEPLITYET